MYNKPISFIADHNWLFFFDALWDWKGDKLLQCLSHFNPSVHQIGVISGSATKRTEMEVLPL